LGRFLRQYLYIPLGGNRRGRARRNLNLVITMVLGGVWHGAGWTFVLWGALHGVYLCLNHTWRDLRGDHPDSQSGAVRVLSKGGAWAITFLAVVLGWVVFRAGSVSAARRIVAGMLGIGAAGSAPAAGFAWVAVGLAIVLFLPNTHDFVLRSAAVPRCLRWAPSPTFAVVAACLALICLLESSRLSEFLYFQF
jgi:alginate O-acetyltransferase complex protein AlgI